MIFFIVVYSISINSINTICIIDIKISVTVDAINTIFYSVHCIHFAHFVQILLYIYINIIINRFILRKIIKDIIIYKRFGMNIIHI